MFEFEEAHRESVGKVNVTQWMTLRNGATASQAAEGPVRAERLRVLLRQMKEHAARLSGKAGFSPGYLAELEQQLDALGDKPQHQVDFLDSLCRLAVARARESS